MKSKSNILCFLFLLCYFQATGQKTDSVTGKLSGYVQALENFARYIPQEKVYLHFDNTSYYQGDNIWFACYVLTTGMQPTSLSQPLYVELLNPGGEIIDKRVLKLENGQCHGEFTLNRLPFYSGFYEVRAYTKYMLNFGEDAIFSRLLPVFNKPGKEGDFEEKEMQKYGLGKYPVVRKKPKKEKKVNLKFFPEGGNLIQGIKSQVAFEATDAYGNPLSVTGIIRNESEEELAHFSTEHEGRGLFSYTPVEGKQKAIINYNDKKYTFEMPPALSEGVVLTVDNLSKTDSIGLTIQKSPNISAERLGLVLLSRGEIQNFCLIKPVDNKAIRFKVDKSVLPSGVTWIVLFNRNGEILCDRLVFTNKDTLLNIKAATDKKQYDPYEQVNMTFSITDNDEKPICTPFSLSVRDGKDEVSYNRNILTDLLLMSEIKGYVNNPAYYFEADDEAHRAALDLLLRVQGWRRYSWEERIGTKPFEIKYVPEQNGIVTEGEVVSFVRKKPKPGVKVSSFLLKRGENEEAANFMDVFETDSLGKFAFVANVEGKWNMILSVAEKGKKKDYRIILNRLFSPEPVQYKYTDLQINTAGTSAEDTTELIEPESKKQENIQAIFKAYEDSLQKAGIHERVYHLDEVTIKAKKRTREKDIFESRTKSVAYYDVRSEWEDIKDEGKYIGNDIHELMMNMNKNFSRAYSLGEEFLLYKGKTALFVINYEPTMATQMDMTKYKLIRLEAIKSIYISEDLSTMLRYADPRISPLEIDKLYSGVILIETYPEGQIPSEAGKGVRKTWLEGYSQVKEFYNPDYSKLPQEPDYRRTLYWNPSVLPDANGKANIQFYNNSRCRKFRMNAETITPQGGIGTYQNY